MTKLAPIAFLIVLSSAAAASACCFFKCCYKSAAPMEASGANAIDASKAVTILPYLRISSVGGQAPNSANDIPNDINPRVDLQVTVDSNFDPSMSNPELTLTDNGPRTAIVPEKLGHKKYKPKLIHLKPKTESMPLPGAGSGPPVSSVWEMIYQIPKADLAALHNYSLVATAGGLTSATVTFRTSR